MKIKKKEKAVATFIFKLSEKEMLALYRELYDITGLDGFGNGNGPYPVVTQHLFDALRAEVHSR